MSPRRLVKTAGIGAWHLINILKNAPGQLRDVARRLSRGQWQVNIRHQNLDYLAQEIDRSSNRLSFAVIIAAVIIGSSWVITTSREVTVLNFPVAAFGVVGYMAAGIMGLGLVISIWRSGKL